MSERYGQGLYRPLVAKRAPRERMTIKSCHIRKNKKAHANQVEDETPRNNTTPLSDALVVLLTAVTLQLRGGGAIGVVEQRAEGRSDVHGAARRGSDLRQDYKRCIPLALHARPERVRRVWPGAGPYGAAGGFYSYGVVRGMRRVSSLLRGLGKAREGNNHVCNLATVLLGYK